jgi:hypothetical protein
MVAKPAPLIMSAKKYCSSLIEALIPVHPLPSAGSSAPRCRPRRDSTAAVVVCIAALWGTRPLTPRCDVRCAGFLPQTAKRWPRFRHNPRNQNALQRNRPETEVR